MSWPPGAILGFRAPWLSYSPTFTDHGLSISCPSSSRSLQSCHAQLCSSLLASFWILRFHPLTSRGPSSLVSTNTRHGLPPFSGCLDLSCETKHCPLPPDHPLPMAIGQHSYLSEQKDWIHPLFFFFCYSQKEIGLPSGQSPRATVPSLTRSGSIWEACSQSRQKAGGNQWIGRASIPCAHLYDSDKLWVPRPHRTQMLPTPCHSSSYNPSIASCCSWNKTQISYKTPKMPPMS